ncbi:hypothetical protein ElyMa_006970600 [Elysia marginata]|uniref:Uncharacterized protein n=1 Tax=Elysia marginata TaxID=1093978 RepID=A0AAV4JLM2_9GAST|nr:hypothetical protein ElyMa_006970600 [Elysia marginata]
MFHVLETKFRLLSSSRRIHIGRCLTPKLAESLSVTRFSARSSCGFQPFCNILRSPPSAGNNQIAVSAMETLWEKLHFDRLRQPCFSHPLLRPPCIAPPV